MQVRLAPKNEEEDINDDDEVEHMQGEPLWVTWLASDFDSGIRDVRICIDLVGASSSCLQNDTAVKTLDGSSSTASFRDDGLLVTRDGNKTLYHVRLLATNGAGIPSREVSSKQFIVLRANVAGVVKDGREEEDGDFSKDKTSIAATFSDFSSDACGIVGYEWGIGTAPFATDVMPYTDYGLVVDDDGNGFAQAHIMQFEGQQYYSTVRARTGHGCSEEYIVSSSDGFVLDTTPPTANFHFHSRELTSQEVVYQTETDMILIGWSVLDPSGINETLLTRDMFSSSSSLDAAPAESTNFTLKSPPVSGDSVFSALTVTDKAGNQAVLPVPTVTLDFLPPALQGLKCTDAVSTLSNMITCSWATVDEPHSALESVQFGLGSGPSVPNLYNFTTVPLERNTWQLDIRDITTESYVSQIFVIVRVTNAAGLKAEDQVTVIYDRTPPSVGKVSIVTSPREGFHDVEQQCQTAVDYVEVLVADVEDTETDIDR